MSESIKTRNLLNQVFRSYNEVVVRYLTLRTRSLQDTMEIAQEAYARVLSMAEPENILDIEAYIFGIAKSIHVDRVRSSRIGAVVGFALFLSTARVARPREGLDPLSTTPTR